MSDTSSIEWTDATWNPIRGCVKVSPGCAHCYAETFAERFRGVPGHPYEQGFDLRLVPEKLQEPLKWKEPRRIFVNSMSDLFQEGVPDQFITDVFGVMTLAYWHTFQILTKRPARMLEYLAAGDHGVRRQFCQLQINGGTATRDVFRALDQRRRRTGNDWPWPLPNVWLGVSVENQHFADERIPLLLQTPAAVRFISAEPLLGGVNIEPWLSEADGRNLLSSPAEPALATRTPRSTVRQTNPQPVDARAENAGSDEPATRGVGQPWLDWVIVGGESGPGARPFEVRWARSIVQQCKAAGVPCFVKQLGRDVRDRNDAGFEGDTPTSWPMDTDVEHDIHGYREEYQGAPVRVRLVTKKGGDPAEWPIDLRVREFPKARA